MNMEKTEERTSVSGSVSSNFQGTVLLVDDEAIILDVGREMLRSLGFQVLTAKDGFEAIEVLKAHEREIDFVILDLTMPNMDGEKVFHKLHELYPDLKIILSSGYTEDIVARRFTTLKPDGFIQKPYQLSSLREKISIVLGADRIP